MKKKHIDYEFVNSKTSHIIGYLSLTADMDEKERTEQLKKKRAELAIDNKMFIELIYWQEQDHGVR
jgi:hypothetical protein